MPIIKTIAGFVAAVLVTYVAGTVFISQGNLSQVANLGLEVDLGIRLQAAIHDITHMTGLYLPLLAIGLVIGFLVARGVLHFVPNLRLIGYTLAGFVAMVALHAIAEAALGMVAIAPTRFVGGLVLQGVAGALGGMAFHLATRSASAPA